LVSFEVVKIISSQIDTGAFKKDDIVFDKVVEALELS
jgi:hypothetical protein